MNRNIITLISIFIFGCATTKNISNTPEIITSIWTKQTNIRKAISYEDSLNGNLEIIERNVSLSESIYPLLRNFTLAQPLIVKRKENGFLPLYIEYFFSKPDSVIRFISYNWEKERYGNFFDKQKSWQEENTKENKYNLEFEEIKRQLIRKYGQPTNLNVKQVDNLVWNHKDYYAELNLIFKPTTHRIRFTYYWK